MKQPIDETTSNAMKTLYVKQYKNVNIFDLNFTAKRESHVTVTEDSNHIHFVPTNFQCYGVVLG